MNDWSFTQLCGSAGVSQGHGEPRHRGHRGAVFQDTLPTATSRSSSTPRGKGRHRPLHPRLNYTRLYNADILAMLAEFATDFRPPQKAAFGGKRSGGTGLYAGEQDMFVFLIDPTGWAEIEGQALPRILRLEPRGGKRSLGIQTFWFQAVCQNHIVWDAVEVVEFTRKHTANVGESLAEIRRIVEQLVAKRDQRRTASPRSSRRRWKTETRRRRRGGRQGLTKIGTRPEPLKPALGCRGQGQFHRVRRGRAALTGWPERASLPASGPTPTRRPRSSWNWSLPRTGRVVP